MLNQLTPRVYNLLICCLLQHFFHLHSRNPPSHVSRISTTGVFHLRRHLSTWRSVRRSPVCQDSHGNIAMGNSTRWAPTRFPLLSSFPGFFLSLHLCKKKWLARCFKRPWNLYIGKSNVTLEPSGSNCLKSSTTRGSSPLNIKAWSEHRGSLYDFQT